MRFPSSMTIDPEGVNNSASRGASPDNQLTYSEPVRFPYFFLRFRGKGGDVRSSCTLFSIPLQEAVVESALNGPMYHGATVGSVGRARLQIAICLIGILRRGWRVEVDRVLARKELLPSNASWQGRLA